MHSSGPAFPSPVNSCLFGTLVTRCGGTGSEALLQLMIENRPSVLRLSQGNSVALLPLSHLSSHCCPQSTVYLQGPSSLLSLLMSHLIF